MVTVKKKPKQAENIDNAGGGEDKISRLPDELIHHILSFLTTKCAISTCILSKRFNCVSNSITTLDFRELPTLWGNSARNEKEQETKKFMNFLDTVLYHHDKPNIRKFYLDLNEFFDTFRVHNWIRTIISRKVEEFCLYVYHPSTSSIFPLSFFTCDSFTLLDLHFSRLTPCKLNIPNTISFPNLKKLQLRGVSFLNEASNRKFFSNCPILEELALFYCEMSEGLYIVNPALKRLFVIDCLFTESKVEISAPGLLTISYTGTLPAGFVLNSIPSLVDATVDFDFERFGYPMVLVKLFEKLSSVKHLKISDHSFQVLTVADILSTSSFALSNLIQLEISTQLSYVSGLGSISNVRTLFEFLQSSPNLESILFAQSIGIHDEGADGCWSIDPKCSLPHLKSIEFKDFDGKPAELNAIKLFLKYAGFLETVTIIASSGLSKDLKKLVRVTKLLLKLPRTSNCVVDVCYKKLNNTSFSWPMLLF